MNLSSREKPASVRAPYDLGQYFGAAYLINLKDRNDRLAAAKKEFARAGWRFGLGGIEAYPAKRFSERLGFPSPQVRGCFYSHWECLRAAHAQGKKSVLIMEDDIALAPSIKEIIPPIMSDLSVKPWGVIYLGHEDTGAISNANSHSVDVSLMPFTGIVRGCHFYAVSGSVLPKLLHHLERVATGVEGDQEFGPMPIDGALSIFRRNNPDVVTLIAAPKVGWQRASRSDIAPRAFDRIRVARPLVTFLRNAKNHFARSRS